MFFLLYVLSFPVRNTIIYNMLLLSRITSSQRQVENVYFAWGVQFIPTPLDTALIIIWFLINFWNAFFRLNRQTKRNQYSHMKFKGTFTRSKMETTSLDSDKWESSRESVPRRTAETSRKISGLFTCLVEAQENEETRRKKDLDDPLSAGVPDISLVMTSSKVTAKAWFPLSTLFLS